MSDYEDSHMYMILFPVWICTNTHMHASAMRMAIAADKCIAVEKPVCDSPEDIRELYSLAAFKKLPIHACFHRRLEVR